jgi:cobaltochelatase CobS
MLKAHKKETELFEVRMVLASDVFKEVSGIDLEVPFFTWHGEAQNIPEVDKDYQFNAVTLLPVLWALKTGRKAWLHGHTGTGKSTLIAQVCARLNWPMMRVNFDSEITRMDLIGRDVLENKDGVTQSRFVDGILPQAISHPCVLLCDEVDFVRPDVSYVFQRALEDEGILVAEDGGRLVKPHQFSRIIATANTQGQGDDFGIYQGARAQSLAFLDRFTVWVKFDYLLEEQERKIIKALVPDLSAARLKEVLSYTKEHREAFLGSKVMQPLSPRGVIAFASALQTFDEMGKEGAFKLAATTTLLSKANPSDAAVIKGIMDRVDGSKAGVEDSKKK